MHDTTDHPSRPRSRRAAALGVAAGLLGGGAVGLTLGVPGLSSASSGSISDGSTVEIADHSGARYGPRMGSAAMQHQHDSGGHGLLREVLEPLVDDGTLTAKQADAVADHLRAHREANAPERGHPGSQRPGGPLADGARIAEALGLEVDDLWEQLRAGATIAEIVEALGVDVDAVIAEALTTAAEHLQRAVADGRLTEDEAAERLALLEERLARFVEDGPPLHR